MSLNSAYVVKINIGPKQVSRVVYILLRHAFEKVMEIRAVRSLGNTVFVRLIVIYSHTALSVPRALLILWFVGCLKTA